ncbi:alkylated DNA repair protein ALKBH8 homolog [Musa acuminata AAA Group]|uniref:alkylated DNA repair protein ALKBH8 homolog n=1 Tax=Musa acuminata AAA Group TaxID=214697 RepID=UPI0031DA0909
MSLTVIFQKELFSVVGTSLGSVLEFFSTMRNRPASDAVALLSINWFILGTLSSRTLPVIAHMLAPSAIRIAVQLPPRIPSIRRLCVGRRAIKLQDHQNDILPSSDRRHHPTGRRLQVFKDIFFPVSLLASDLGIPGIYLVHDFITVEEEKRLLAEVDNRQWRSLSKKRVQHYGYEFLYEVNEYPCVVGLSPHIDTHSAFDELIFSPSTAGPCIMEFRRYPEGTWCHPTASVNEIHEDTPLLSSYITRKAIFLPPRSMILMSGEGRYAWHHYIPHRKVNNFLQVDRVGEKAIGRSSRRVSFTFRKVRKGPCCCPYKQYCDSQLECRNQQVKQNIVK